MKYRKKPVEIEAVIWDEKNEKEVMDFLGWRNAEIDKKNGLGIFTLEGRMQANIGDYIIKGVKGEFYPCKPDIFEMTYEKVEPNFETYCIEVTRDSEEPFVFHAKFDHYPTRQEILDEIEDQEINYDDNYGKIDFYKVI